MVGHLKLRLQSLAHHRSFPTRLSKERHQGTDKLRSTIQTEHETQPEHFPLRHHRAPKYEKHKLNSP